MHVIYGIFTPVPATYNRLSLLTSTIKIAVCGFRLARKTVYANVGDGRAVNSCDSSAWALTHTKLMSISEYSLL